MGSKRFPSRARHAVPFGTICANKLPVALQDRTQGTWEGSGGVLGGFWSGSTGVLGVVLDDPPKPSNSLTKTRVLRRKT